MSSDRSGPRWRKRPSLPGSCAWRCSRDPSKPRNGEEGRGVAELVDLAVNAPHAKVLDDEVILDPVLRALAPHARFLHAAKRSDFGGDDSGVDAHDAVFEGLGAAPAAVHLGCGALGPGAAFT